MEKSRQRFYSIRSSSTYIPSCRKKVVFDRIVYTDTYKSCYALDLIQFRHTRINHSTLFADKVVEYVCGRLSENLLFKAQKAPSLTLGLNDLAQQAAPVQEFSPYRNHTVQIVSCLA